MSYSRYAYSSSAPTVDVSVSTYPKGATVVGSSHDPHIFGASMWFTFHNGATAYPSDPTPRWRSGMKSFIANVPFMVPCDTCREHFFTFISACNLDDAVSTRDKLFKFYVDAHNYVNARVGMPSMSLADARTMYGMDDPLHGAVVRITYGSAPTASLR